MRLIVSTPMSIPIDEPSVQHVRAEDESGAFGVLAGHADFLTVLNPSVLSWRRQDNSLGHAAVSGGIFTVRDKGRLIEIATRQVVVADRLEDLADAVSEQFRAGSELDKTARVSSSQLQIRILRKIQEYLSATQGGLRSRDPALEGQSLTDGLNVADAS